MPRADEAASWSCFFLKSCGIDAPTPDAPAMRDRPAPPMAVAGKELDEPPQVLRGCGEQNLVPRAAQASQPKPVEPEDAFHVRKSHRDLFALAA